MFARNLRAILATGTAISLAFSASPAAAQLVRSGDLVDAIDSGGNPGTLTVVDTTPTQTDMTVLAPVVVANWSRFNVPTGTTVNVANGTANPTATLINRVIGSNLSDISGSINAPDVNLWLINQNGILFGDGALVNSASFFASTLDVSDADLFDFYQGSNLAGNGTNTLQFGSSLGNVITTSSPNVTFVTDGSLMFVSESLNLNANFDAGTGRASFVTAADASVTFTPGSPLTYVVNAGTTVAEAQTIGGSINAAGTDFAMFTAAGVVNAVLRVDATVSATAAIPTDNGIRLIAEQLDAGTVTVELNGAINSTGTAVIGTDGNLEASAPLTASGLSLFAGGSGSFADLTATSAAIDIDVLGGNLVAGDVRAVGDITFQTPNASSATFGSLVSSGGLVAVQGLIPGTLTVSGLTSGNIVSLVALNALDVGDVIAGSGNLLLDALFGSVNAGDVTGTGGLVSLRAGATISAGAVSATTGNAILRAAGNITTASIDSALGAIDVDSTGGGALNLGTLNAGSLIDLDTSGSLTTGPISAGGALVVGGTIDPNGVTFTGDVQAQSITIDTVGGLNAQDLTATNGAISLDVLGAGSNLVAGDVRAVGDITFQTPNASSATFGSLVSSGGLVGVAGFVPGTLTVSGLTSGNTVSLVAVNALDVGDVVAASGNLLLSSSNSSVTAGDVTGAGVLVSILAGTTISAGTVSATTGNANLRAGDNITTTSISSALGSIDVDSTSGGTLDLGNLSAGGSITIDTAGDVLAGTVNASQLSVGGSIAPSAASFAGRVAANVFSARVTGALSFGAVNQIENIAGISVGAPLSFANDTDSLTIDGLVTSGGNDITIRNTGDITIAEAGQIDGRTVVLSAGEQFINLRGSDAIAASDRWAVYSAAPAGNTFGGLDSGNTAIWNGTIDTISPGSLTGNRYVFAFQPTLTLTSTDLSKVYGTDLTGALDGFFTVSGLQDGVAGAYLGDTLSSVLTGSPVISSPGAAANADVASGPYAMTISAGSLAAANGYALSFDSSGLLTVTPRPITGSVVVNDRVYDGTTAATGTVTLNDVLAGDDIGTAGTVFTFTDRNVGTNRTVTISGTTLTGTDASNYTLTMPASALADIIARAITGSVVVNDRVYDGTTAATGTVTLNGVIAGDDVGTTGTVFTFTDRNVGTNRTVTISGTTLTGTDAGNYTLTMPATALADIIARAITGSVVVNDRVYDGTTAATGTVTLNGVIAGDDVGTTGTVFTFTDRNAGTNRTVTISGTTLTGADAGNYTLTMPASALADIVARLLVITADDQEKTQGSPDPALTFEVGGDGLVAGDSLSGALARDAGELPGDYAITQGTLDAGGNYVIQFENGTLTIAPLPFRQVPLRSQALPSDLAGGSSAPGLIVDAAGLCDQDEDAACQPTQ